MNYRIAIGALLVECNHFGGIPTDIASFQRTQYLHGNELLTLTDGTIGGFLHTLGHPERQCTFVPTIAATACPGGLVLDSTYQSIKTDLLAILSTAQQDEGLDGILLALHGSAAAESECDLEGNLLQAVRTTVGPDIPIVATLDLHAHVTQRMLDFADVLIAWETYPHCDAAETGSRAAQALMDILQGTLQPTMAMGMAPVLVGAINGGTSGDGPFAQTMKYAKSIEARPEVYSTSAFLVHPYLDAPEMGGGGLVITNNASDLARQLAQDIAEYYWEQRFSLEPTLISVPAAINTGQSKDGTVVLVDTADCCGGGAAGDSIEVLPHLIALGENISSVMPLVDSAAADKCHEAGIGAVIELQLGHQHDRKWGVPLHVSGEVLSLSDGKFIYAGGIWDGCEGNMGPAAVLKISGVHVCIASFPTYEWCGEQYSAFALDVTRMKYIVAKNPMNYRMAFGHCCEHFLVLDTKGPTPATCKHLPYSHSLRPAFPWDSKIIEPIRVLGQKRPLNK
ncbi:MAG: M81 family metallopeptidase [Planctomycetaceae bacterium]|jgi:microcystin degradation protein MlrC|nr:M81 family metallopeptidase [Planctomycetaceae bacterium]